MTTLLLLLLLLALLVLPGQQEWVCGAAGVVQQ
jgi:hypothetical protein